MLSVTERIERLREHMKANGVDVTYIPTSDCHDSEYISDHFKARQYFSGFSGSAGDLVVTMEEAFLFTDGRYFIQAEEQLKGSGIKLMKIGEPNTPKLKDHLIKCAENKALGLDGRLINASFGMRLRKGVEAKGGRLIDDFDPAEGVWKERPLIKYNPLFILEDKYTGESVTSKIAKIRESMEHLKCRAHIISSLDDIAYILNLRGNDIECCPVFLSYLMITMDSVCVYLGADLTDEVAGYLKDNNIEVLKYENFYEDLEQRVKIWTNTRVLLDNERINSRIHSIVSSSGARIVSEDMPSTWLKARKNETEIRNIEEANVKDGVCMLRFEMWLNDMIASGKSLSELLVSDKLYELRSGMENFVELSFETIAGFGEHGAIVHYAPTKESNASFGGDVKGSFLLVDSGAHYLNGTTDVTRTYPIGEVPYELKENYTLVLKGMLRILKMQFPKGTRGANIDSVCREVFWNKGLDFKHGTGHGIGYLLNVHEGPVRISYSLPNGEVKSPVFEPGMLTSDEPGLYIEGSHGIRIENDILCEKRFSNEYGDFLGFKPMTYVPIDLRPVIIEMLDRDEIEALNDYHRTVYEKLSPMLSGDELTYLKKVTKAILQP